MGKKKNHHHHHDDDGGAEKQDAGGEMKKDNKNTNNVVLKADMHCEGCASKIIKLARSFEGVESVKADADSQKITVIGKVDPYQIRDFLHSKTKKKVEIISPQIKKEDSNAKNDNNKKSDGKKPADTTTNNKNTSDNNNNNNNKPKDKNKEAPVVTAVIKVAFHCLGCIQKIQSIVSKTKGVQEITLDKQKETVTVKGAMDVKALTEVLKARLKRPVEIVPSKKEKDGEKDTGGEGKKKSGGGSESQGGSKGGGDSGGGGVGGRVVEGNRMEYMVQPGYGFDPGYGYMGQPVYGNGYMGAPVPVYGNGYVNMAPQAVPVYDYGYGYGHVPGYPVHMKFNDENPNACTVM